MKQFRKSVLSQLEISERTATATGTMWNIHTRSLNVDLYKMNV